MYRVQINFSKVICQNLACNSNSYETLGRALISPIELWGQNAIQILEKVYKCKWKFCGFTVDKNSSRRKLLICEFQETLRNVIHKKTKLIREL